MFERFSIIRDWYLVKNCIYQSNLRWPEEFNSVSHHDVVVITSASHAEGPQFEPAWWHFSMFQRISIIRDWYFVKNRIYQRNLRWPEEFNIVSHHAEVVITSSSHAESPRLEPAWWHFRMFERISIIGDWYFVKNGVYQSNLTWSEECNNVSHLDVVVITSSLHEEGPRFEPAWWHFNLFERISIIRDWYLVKNRFYQSFLRWSEEFNIFSHHGVVVITSA